MGAWQRAGGANEGLAFVYHLAESPLTLSLSFDLYLSQSLSVFQSIVNPLPIYLTLIPFTDDATEGEIHSERGCQTHLAMATSAATATPSSVC